MKKSIGLILMGFLSLSLSAQEEVVFKFSRENVKPGRKLLMPVKVNGAEAGRLINGDSLTYKTTLDLTQPIEVAAFLGLTRQKRVITVYPKVGEEVVFDATFLGGQFGFDLVSGASLTPGTGTVAGGKINKTNLGISYTSTTTHASDTLRQQWVDKGGRMEGFSRVGSVSITSMSSSGMKMFGAGLQITLTGTYLNLKIPERKSGLQTWNSMVYGFSFSELLSFYSTKIEIEGMDPMKSTGGTLQMIISANGGYTLGVGKFKTDTRWKGVAFELTYRPSLIVVYPLEDFFKVDVQLNMTGFGFDINFNSFTSNAMRLAPKAQSKFTFFMLPPIKNGPLIITAGYGRTIYRKIYK